MSLDRQRLTEASELRGGQWKEASTESKWKGKELKVKSRAAPGPWCWHAPPRQLQVLLGGSPGPSTPAPSLPTFEDRSLHGTRRPHGILQS